MYFLMYASCQMRIAAKNCGAENSIQPLHTDFLLQILGGAMALRKEEDKYHLLHNLNCIFNTTKKLLFWIAVCTISEFC